MPDEEIQLDSNYEVIEQIADGALGAILKVRHKLLDEVRVAKIVKPEIEVTPEIRKSFLKEAQTAIRFRHPNVVHVHDLSVDDAGNRTIFMEYVDGLTFKQILATSGPPPLALTLELLSQFLSAVHFLHARGYLHHDISPDNAMLTTRSDGQPLVKLLDLGLVKPERSKLTQSSTFVGKVRYASPERFSQAEIDQRSDIYSVGLVLYEMLTGVCPIQGEAWAELMNAHLNKPMMPFESSDPEGRVPVEVRDLVARCLEKDPAQRFQATSEIIEAMAACRENAPATDLVSETRRILDVAPTATQPKARAAAPPPAQEEPDESEFGATVVMSVDQLKQILEGPPPDGSAVPAPAAAEEPAAPEPVAKKAPPAPVVPPAPAAAKKPDKAADESATPRKLALPSPLVLAIAGAALLVVVLLAVFLLGGGEEAEAPTAAVASVALTIDATPWARVISVKNGADEMLDGERHTPLLLSLPPGNYEVSLAGPDGSEQTVSVVVGEAGAEVRHDFPADIGGLLEDFGVPADGAGGG